MQQSAWDPQCFRKSLCSRLFEVVVLVGNDLVIAAVDIVVVVVIVVDCFIYFLQ